MFWRLTLLAALASGVLLSVDFPAKAQRSDPSRRGSSRAATLSVHWEGLSLGDAIERLRRSAGLEIALDRRVDPNQRVTLSAADAPADEIVAQLAVECSLGVGRVGDLYYLGPPEVAARLATLAAERRRDVGRLPDNLRASLTQRKRIAWPRLSEPRDLIVRLGAEHGWRIESAERILFDLWPAGHLPRLALADQTTVLLVGFDLSYRLVPDRRAIEIVPIDWSALQPRAAAARRAPAPHGDARQTYTLRVQEQPVGAVLTQLARQLGWRLEVDEVAIRAAGKSLDTRISFYVENADADQLLEALLAPAGLMAERNGDRVKVLPRSSKLN